MIKESWVVLWVKVRNIKRLMVTLALVVLGMFGFGFALVPIYNSLCKDIRHQW